MTLIDHARVDLDLAPALTSTEEHSILSYLYKSEAIFWCSVTIMTTPDPDTSGCLITRCDLLLLRFHSSLICPTKSVFQKLNCLSDDVSMPQIGSTGVFE